MCDTECVGESTRLLFFFNIILASRYVTTSESVCIQQEAEGEVEKNAFMQSYGTFYCFQWYKSAFPDFFFSLQRTAIITVIKNVGKVIL